MVKNQPVTQETWVRSLSWEDSLEERKIISGASCQGGWRVVGVLQMSLRGGREGDGTHSSTLAWKIPWTEGPGGLQSMGLLGVGHD